MSAVPVPDPRLAAAKKRQVLAGDVPSPSNPPPACRFHTRCWKAQEICSSEEPQLEDKDGGNIAACHFPLTDAEVAERVPSAPQCRLSCRAARDGWPRRCARPGDGGGDRAARLGADGRRGGEPPSACAQGAIVKSLVFRAARRAPLLALVGGDRRADEAQAGGAGRRRSWNARDAAFVREVTGFAIGGVPPLGHPAPLRTLMDEGLWRFDEVWAAAGTPHAVFGVAPGDLARAVGAAPAELT